MESLMTDENKYIEKIALNATKARALAKAVGIVPDHTTNWKWGIRQLRDSRGNALQGKVLERAKINMGSMGSENFQKLQKAQAANPDHELGYGVHKGKLSGVFKGRNLGITMDMRKFHKSTGGLKGHIGHTHHVGPSVNLHELPDLVKHPARISKPSGLADHGEVNGVYKKKTEADVHYSDWLQDKLKESDLHMDERVKIWNTHSPKTLNHGGSGRDIQSSIILPNEINKKMRISRQSISTPEKGFETVSRNVGMYDPSKDRAHLLKHRSVTFSHEKKAQSDTIEGIGQTALGAKILSHAPKRLLGYHTVYHGTSKETANTIRKEGLDPSKGGTGAAKAHQSFADVSKGKVHVTKSPLYARAYSSGVARNAFEKVTGSGKGGSVFKDVGKGSVLKARISDEKWKGFAHDIDGGPTKRFAATTTSRIDSSSIVGGAGNMGRREFLNKPHLSKYYGTASGKNRALRGVALGLTGASLVSGGLSKLKRTEE